MAQRNAILLLLCLLTAFSLDARGSSRGRGGGLGALGGTRGGRSIPTPSMSRAGSQSRAQLNRPAQRPAGANRPATQRTSQATRSQVQGFLNQSGTINNRSGQFTQGQLQQNLSRRQNLGNNMRNRQDVVNIRGNLNRNLVGQNWNQGNFLRGASWSAARNWGNWGWSTPYYYDYADGTPYYYAATEPYVASTTQTVTTPAPSSQQWLPLGTYALTQDANAISAPKFYLQLALGKDGSIQGSLTNSMLNKNYDLEGSVDHNTQIAAWKQVDNVNSPIMETGLYNLTQNQAPIQINFSDGSDQNWLLVRLNE